ncbi:MAG TPA: 50S ribosomal protein L32 [Candidatus Magasanikbacteria bacterium]|nr:50S ribosomal protein L32 [Candidatus Magasanikbacteria bacterium]HBX16334.1 50S ribosomal protein L32 [Candidatus Magasanikbacteria bacterium]
MGLPGHRRTSSHKRRRAAHFALTPAQLTTCPKCKKPARPHYACSFCGTFKGRVVIVKKVKAAKKK